MSANGYRLFGSRCVTQTRPPSYKGSFMRILISALALMPAAALASSAFDGTWKTRLDSMKTTGKPDVIAVVDGTYTCSSCQGDIKVKADGADHTVTGNDYYDSVAVKIVDPK